MYVDTEWWVNTFKLRPLQPQRKVTPWATGSYMVHKRGSRHPEEDKHLSLLQESRLAHSLINGNDEKAITKNTFKGKWV